MNNTHTALLEHSGQQHSFGGKAALHAAQHQQHFAAYPGSGSGSGDSTMLPVQQGSNECLVFNGSGAAPSSSSGGGGGGGGGAAAAAAAGLGELHDDALHHGGPLMLAPADSLLSQGSTDLCGLGDAFDAETSHQRAAAAAAAAGGAGVRGGHAGGSRCSIEMTDVLLPGMGVGAGSPLGLQAGAGGSHSPGLSHFGGNGAALGGDAGFTADSLGGHHSHHHGHSHHRHGNGGGSGQYGAGYCAALQQPPQHHHALYEDDSQAGGAQQQLQQQQQQLARAAHTRAAQQRSLASSRAGSSAAAAAAAAGAAGAAVGVGVDGQPVFRSQYRGVSYDKKKRKWRVQIKVAALGKSGACARRQRQVCALTARVRARWHAPACLWHRTAPSAQPCCVPPLRAPSCRVSLSLLRARARGAPRCECGVL
jgi:hypothetical protein